MTEPALKPFFVLCFSCFLVAAQSGAQQKPGGQENRGLGLPTSSIKTSAPDQLGSGPRPEVVIQSSHTKAVNALAFAPDASWLASGANDDTIKIWDTATGHLLRTLYGHSANINALAVSPDGKLLASGSGDMISKREFPTFRGGGIAGGARDNTIKIWDVHSGREIRTLSGHVLPVGGVAFSGDGRTLTSASGDAIKVWDVASGKELRSQKTKYDKSGMEKWDSFRSFSIFGRDKRETQQAEWQKNLKLSDSRIVVSADGQLAAVGQPDKGIWIYDALSGREIRQLTFQATPETEHSSVAFSASGRLVAFAKTREVVTVQEATTGRELYDVNTGNSAAPQRVSFSPNERFLITVTDPGDSNTRPLIKLFDAKTGQFIRDLPGHPDQNGLRVVTFSNDHRLLATAGRASKAISVIDVVSGNELRALGGTADKNVAAERTAFLNTIDPKMLADFQSRGIRSPEQIVDAIESLGAVANDKFPVGSAVSMSADGRYIVSRRLLLKSVITETWDTMTGTPVRIQEADASRERGKPHFSPDGRFRAAPDFPMKGIYTTSAHDYNIFSSGDDWDKVYDQKIQIFDGKAGKKLRALDGGKADEVGIVPVFGFSFDSSLVGMTGFENKAPVVFIYETASGRKVKKIELVQDDQSGSVAALAISANARLLAVAHATKIDLFDISSGRTVRSLPHKGRLTSITFSPHEKFLVALGENNDKYIWNAVTGEKLATLINLTGSFSGQHADWLVVTPDGLFDGSPSGWNQILWQFRGNTFDVTPGETFFNEFYYPGLLGDIMSGRKPRAPRNIAQIDRRQPEVALATDDLTASDKVLKREIRIRIRVAEKAADNSNARGSGAKDLRLFRNGSLVKIWRGDVLKDQSTATFEATIPVIAGENRLTAYAFNRDNVKSKDATMNLVGTESIKRQPTAFVLAIGINAYENPQYNLKYAMADAQDFAEEFRRQQQKLSRYQRVEIIPLSDQEATKANILLALKRLAGGGELPATAPASLKQIAPAQPEDSVVVFYAGHGTAQGQRFYLLPHDLGYKGERTALDATGLETMLSHGISDTEFEHAVENIDVSNFVLVIDACNSGQALEAEEKRRGPMNSKGLAQLAYEKGMYILTAAQSYQAALESAQLGHGYLTYALVEEGLKTVAADTAPRDSLVSIREWLDFATERVPQLQEQKTKTRDLVLKTDSAAGDGGAQKNSRVSDVQRPRAFYRREIEPAVLIVARP
ncbi:MAG TPA: caspase family protein [Pyrinomonadaceae bacterium]|nr:caspase family protein [Pyrinomonadaceae bacterium]